MLKMATEGKGDNSDILQLHQPVHNLSIKTLIDIYSKYVKTNEAKADRENLDKIKTLALDLFLTKCISREKETGEFPRIYNMKSIVNQLCQEFMNDIIKVTSGQDDDDDPAVLQKYLLEGRGWLLLYILYKNGVQSLSVSREFGKLLVSLLPWCLKFETSETSLSKPDDYLYRTLHPLTDCFCHLNKSAKWRKANKHREKAIPQFSQEKSVRETQHEENNQKRYKKQAPEKVDNISSESDAEQSKSTERKLKHTSRRYYRYSYNPEPQQAVAHQNSDEEEEQEEIKLLISSTDVNVKHMTSPQYLCSLIVDLIQEISFLDLNQTSMSKVLCPTVMPNLLHIFSSFYPKSKADKSRNDDVMAASWKNCDRIFFQRKLLRLILTLGGIIATQQNGVNILVVHKFTSILLDLAQQVYGLHKIKAHLSVTSDKLTSVMINFPVDLVFMSEIVLGFMMCLDNVFMCLSLNLVHFQKAVHLVEDFDDNHGFELVEFIICSFDQSKTKSGDSNFEIDWLDEEPIRIVSSFLHTIKSVKVNYIHSMKCLKKKHQKCRYSFYFNHHHDILGLPVTQGEDSGMENARGASPQVTVCLVASWCGLFLDLLPKISSKFLQIEVLRVVCLSGICCCMSLESLVKGILGAMKHFSPAVRNHALEALNRVILELFSYSEEKSRTKSRQSFLCQNCMTNLAQKYKIQEMQGFFAGENVIDSGFSSHDQEKVNISAMSVTSKWSVLDEFRTLLFCEDFSLAEIVAKHLYYLAIHGSVKLKEELFTRIYIHAFSSFLGNLKFHPQSSSEEDLPPKKEFSKEVQLHCLSALPYLLQVDTVLQTFLTKRGIGNICNLLEDYFLRAPVLKVFETLVFLDEQKLAQKLCQNEDLTASGQERNINDGMVIKAFINGLARKTDCNAKSNMVPQSSDTDSGLSDNASDLCSSTNWHDFSAKNLPVIVDMWESCERICLHSEKFVFHLKNSECLKIAERTLIYILEELLSTTKCDKTMEVLSQESEMETDTMATANSEGKIPVVCFMKLSLLRALLTICSSCYLELPKEYTKDGVQVKMWRTIKGSFQGFTTLPAAKLKTLFDVLLNAAMPKVSSILDYKQANSLYQMFIKDDEIEDEEVRQLLQLSSDDENDSIFNTDRGYDADSECSSDRKEVKLSESTTQRIYYASLFRLLIELLIESQQTTSGQEVLPIILLKLLQILRANQTAVMAVCDEGLLTDILTGFWKQLVENQENKDTSVRNSLLSLIQLLAQHRLTAHELQKILQLFQYSKIPKDLLLSTFMSIVENSTMQPYLSLKFPVKRKDKVHIAKNRFTKSSSFRDRANSSSPMSQSLSWKRLSSTPDLTDDHGGIDLMDNDKIFKSEDELKCWNVSAVYRTLTGGISWPPIETGFSLSIWLQFDRVQGCSRKESSSSSQGGYYTSSTECSAAKVVQGRQPTVVIADCLHICSIGNKDKLFEIWSDCNSGYLLFRLTSESGDAEIVLKEAVAKDVISPGQWHHVMISYVETMESRKQNPTDDSINSALLTGKVTLTVDGWRKHEVTMDHNVQTLNARPKQETLNPSVYIGHTVDDPSDVYTLGHWSLGSVMLFKGTNISNDACFHLYSLGPSCRSISKCDCSSDNVILSPNLTKQVVVHSNIQQDTLAGVKSISLDELRSSIQIHYSPWLPNHFCIYSGIMGRQKMSPALASNLGLPSQQRFDSSYLAQNPVVVKSMSSNAMSSQKHYGLEKAIMETGGLEAILFLTAKVYEDNNHDNHEKDQEHELLQAKALHLLFTLVNHSSTLAKDFVECNGYCLLSKVLTSSRSIVGYHTLKVLMDASTTEPVFRCDPETGNLILRRKSEAMVKNITVITDLILNWKIWEGAEEGVHLLLFLSLASLVREDHHYQRFNVIQFQSVNLISKIFCNYQERIQDGCPSFSPEISQCVISILQSMMGTPPDLHLIVAICDFLLLVHPAANTYISHSQSGFYFSLDCDTPTGPVTHWNQDIRNKLPHPANMSTPIKQDNDTDLESKHCSEKKKKLNFEEVGKYAEKEDIYPKLNEMSPKEMVDMGKSEKQISDDTDVPPTILDYVKGDKATSEETCDSAESALDFSVDVISNEASESESKDQKSHSEIETVSDLEEAEGQTKVHKLKPGSSNVSLTLADFCEIEDGKYSVSLDAGSASGGQSSQMFSDTDSEFSIIGMLAPKTDVHFDKNIEILEHEKGLIALCVGLLQTLVTIVVTLPDNLTDKVLQKIIKTEILIVLAHNSSPEIRTAVLRLLNAYLTRASSEHIENFIQKNGFHLLGAQLYQYPTHEEQLQEVMSLILGKPFCLQDRIDTNYLNINDISEVQQSALILFLSVLENTVSDVALCHNALCIALQMFEGAPLIGSLMLEHGFFTVLCNMVIKINRSENSGTDLDGINENQIILEDLQTIICNIAVREFSASGTIHQQQFEEVLDFLYYIELKEQKTFGIRSVQVQTLKTLQLNVILAILQYIEKASQENKHSSGWLSRQTSSPNVSTDNDLSAHFSQLSTSFLQTKRHNFSTSSLHQGTTRSSQAAPPLMKYSASTSVLIDPRLQDVRSGSPTSECESSSSSLQSLYPPISCSVSSDSSKFPSSPKSGFSFPFRFGKKKRLQIFPASQSDLIDRFKKILITSVDLVVFSNKEEIKRQPNEKKMILLYEKPKPVAMETSYIKRLFDFMYRAFEMTLAQDKNSSRRNRYVIMWGAKDVTRVQLGRLMVYMISNKHDFDDRTYVMSYMLGESRGQEILKKLLTTQELGNEMAFYLHDLLTVWEDWCNTQQREDAFRFLNIIKRAGFTVVSPSVRPTHQELEYLREEKKQLDMNVERGRQVLQKKREPAFTRLLHKNDKLCTQLSALAMEVTQSVTQLQTLERNKFVEHIKRSMTKKIQIKKCWQQIVQNLTHERAVWYCPESYPRSWQLDPTEGPGRVRKRLKRCHLGIDSCFLSEEYRHNLDSEEHDPPLIYLFEDDHQMSDSAALIYQLYKNEKIQHTYKCTAVAPNSESRGELLVGENSVFFVADEAISDANYTQVLLGNKDQLSMTWPYEDLREIHKRWFQLRDIGIEIFLTSGKTCLLACQSKQDRDSLYQHIKGLELPNLVETENLTLAEIQRSWVEGYMTNFDYLTHLNKLAGRSFNDLMQYPVFPFILKEYTTDDLNLKDPGIYRNLSKPISVQEKSREQKYLDNYRILEEEYKKSDQDNISGMRVAPFHYGSHYSNSGSVLHFLVRLPPYTKMFLNFQDNNFDIPDRTFHSMQTTWRLASYQSTSDAKELIPEFFFLPEIFVNSEGFKFGQRQNGEVVWDIQLPPWCKSNPRLFTLIHRQALESDYVSQNLHNWIDLVFGSKQQGELAIKAINVFHPATYFGIDVNSVRDPVKRHALRTMVKTYGQTPKQLFRNPHPQRVTSQSLDNPVSSGVLTQLFQNSFSASTQMDQGHLPYIKSPLNTVTGLKWGSYVGSPHLPPPTVVWQEKFESSVASLEASPTGDVFGVGADSFCLMMHSKQKVLRVFNSTDVVWAAIINWKHPDGILRIKNHKEKPLVNFMHESPTDLVTCCASLPDCRLLFVGGSSGLITIYQTVFNTSKESNIQVRGSKTVLLGHKATVNCLVVCKPYSILISASDDHTCIIWDLNRLCYVRSIDSHKAGVKVVAISPTLGDIASCSPQGMGSRLDLHTVNAELVATKYCDDTINCLAFSSAPEGKSVNIIAGGLSSGNIRIWSSWDLSHLRDLQQDNLIARPVISLTFTHDSQRLYMSTSDGTVSLWESPPFGRLRPHNFTAFL